MTKKPQLGIRLTKLTIENYKKLDKLEIDFPYPLMKNDIDILVFGSKNGGGKTSVLECCSLLLLAGTVGEGSSWRLLEIESSFDIASLLVKAGQQQAFIKGNFELDNDECCVSLKIPRNGSIKLDIKPKDSLLFKNFKLTNEYLRISGFETLLTSVFAFSGEPLILPPLLHFNSYRKIQESNPELGMMAEDYPTHRINRFNQPGMRGTITPISMFKLEILRSLMGRASLFEGFSESESETVLTQLNSLIERYCGGHIENLRPLPDNKMDIRIKLRNTNNSFSFDGLSSGQKEIIATLFLIWKNTLNQPSIVLIDEPELHLNAEWHGDFVEQLRKLAPKNQYILATHSEEIFRSVDESCRAILVPDDSEKAS